MSELVVMGFSDRYRAEEVLGQLRRLDFSWAADLENAVAAEVDARGQLRFRHSLVLDPAFGDSAPAWRALLGAIQAPATRLQPAAKESAGDSQGLSAEALLWRRALAPDPQFLRDSAPFCAPATPPSSLS